MPQPANREGVRRVGVTVTGEDYIVDSGSGFVHTFHRSTSSVGLAGADGEFPVTRAATELMQYFRRKNTTTISPALWLLPFHCSSYWA